MLAVVTDDKRKSHSEFLVRGDAIGSDLKDDGNATNKSVFEIGREHRFSIGV